MISRTWKKLMMKNLEILMEFEQSERYRRVYEAMYQSTRKQLRGEQE